MSVCLLSVYDDLTLMFTESSCSVNMIYLDFSKAFDKVVYGVLLHKLRDMGIAGNRGIWFHSFLSNRYHFVRLLDGSSTFSPVISGVPQGTVLGPLLFLFLMFDGGVLNAKVVSFADDTQLFSYGIIGTILKWFKSYLTNRLQFVTFDGIQSEIKSVKCGVPQGSILGPLLFIIYMNDLYNVSEFLFTILYADDTCVLLHGKHLDDLIIRINKELDLLFIWLQANKLSLNGQKTYYMIFHRARIKLMSHSSNVVIGGSTLTEIDEIKYLGVIIDNKLTWISHITQIKNKVSKGIGIMFKAKKITKKNTLINL